MSGNVLFRVFITLTVFLVVVGCSSRRDATHAPSSRSFFDPLFSQNEYAETFDRWTQRERTHSEWDLTLLVDATFWNKELREAYVEEMSKRFRLTPEEAKNIAYKERLEHEKYFVFILSATTRNNAWNDLDSSKSVWRLTLEDPGESKRVTTARVEKISEKNERAKYFYQRSNRFNETYKVYFPKHSLRDEQRLKLFIAGPRGKISFVFDNPIDSDETRIN